MGSPNPSFWGIPDHENQKFSSTILKIFWDAQSKSFILRHSRPRKSKIFFNHSEDILRWAVQILHSEAFQTMKIKNFLQPWWRYSEISSPNPSFWDIPGHENQKFSSTMVKIFWDKQFKSFILRHSRLWKSKIAFNHSEVILRWAVQILHYGAF